MLHARRDAPRHPGGATRVTIPGPPRRHIGHWLVGVGTALLLAVSPATSLRAAPGSAPEPVRSGKPRAYLIHLVSGGDPIVVQKYVQEGGEVRFEKYGGWVGIPSYEVLRIVPDDGDDSTATLPPAGPQASAPAGATKPVDAPAETPLYVATRSGATIRATSVSASGPEVRVGTPEGSLTFHRGDLVGVLRVPAAPASPEAWITLWDDEASDTGLARSPGTRSGPPTPPLTLSDRPHLLQLSNGVLIQVDGFWLEAGEIRFRRLGGVVGFALGEIARLLPQDVEPVRGRVAARFIRQLGSDRMEVRLGGELQRIRLIGVEPVPGERTLEDPWAALDRGLLLHLEFDRQRYAPGGDWLAYVYLPSGRMLNAELIRVGLARPRTDGRNLRYLDLFDELSRLAKRS